MSIEQTQSFTDADVRSLAAKLVGLHAALTPGEQVLLRATLRRAAGIPEPDLPDTTGFAWAVGFNPLPYLDAITAPGLESGCSSEQS